MAVDGQRFMTKTQHYRKVTKPLLERKRRARMNLYLDELKDLIVDTMEAQGEHIAKLEKADILELTVTYLRTHKHEIAASARQSLEAAIGGAQVATAAASASASAGSAIPPRPLNLEKFRAGYTQAAYEVSRVFATVPGLDIKFGTQLMKHLGYQLKDLQQTSPSANAQTAVAAAALLQQQQQQQQLQQRRQHQQTPPIKQERAAAEEVHNEHPNGDFIWRPW